QVLEERVGALPPALHDRGGRGRPGDEEQRRVDEERGDGESAEGGGGGPEDQRCQSDGGDRPPGQAALGEPVAPGRRRGPQGAGCAGGGRGGHQLAPENSRWRLMIQRATMFTARVITKSTRPAAMSSDIRRPKASGKFSAISAAIVWLPEEISEGMRDPVDRTRATAMVSPRARPRPSITAEMIPARANGSTAMRIISQRVAPRASAASSWSPGVCRKISRDSEVMIGSTITARTMPAVSIVLPVWETGPPKMGRKPRFA